MTEQQPPTREQIAAAKKREMAEYLNDATTHERAIASSWFNAGADAVLALFQQPTPEQECGVCGRHYPASDTRGTCAVCWPGFGEHGQQPTPSAEPTCTCGHVMDDHDLSETGECQVAVPWCSCTKATNRAEPVSIVDMAPGVDR